MVQEAAAGKDCHSTNTDSLTLPAGLFDPKQLKVELVATNLNLKSTSRVFQNTSKEMGKIISIDLSGNQIIEIQENEFSSVLNVIVLNIGNNQLQSIHENSFRGLVNLTELLLWVNQLTKLPGIVLSKLQNLHTLNLHSNRIKKLDVCICTYALAKNLKKLFLESNGVQTIQNCVGYTYIQELYLQKNELTDIEDLKNFEKLITLNLGSNPSLKITEKSFFKWHKLEYLNIDNIDVEGSVKFKESLQDVAKSLRELSMSNNRLEKLSIADFPQQFSNLVTLKIKDNRLTQFDYDLLKAKFPILNQIAITGNRWDCNYLTKMIGDFKVRGIKLLDVPPPAETVINVDGVPCFTSNNRKSLYITILSSLGAVIVVIAITLFFIQMYLVRRRSLGATNEQSPLQKRLKSLY
jgi:Leucine-rich repeat (LRR) protein